MGILENQRFSKVALKYKFKEFIFFGLKDILNMEQLKINNVKKAHIKLGRHMLNLL